MSIFTPSEHFNERWLQSPKAIKNAIYDELTDIITLLQSQTKTDDFEFTHLSLNDSLAPLQEQHLAQQKAKLYAKKQEEAEQLLPKLEEQIDVLIKQKCDDITYELTKYASDIKIWLKQTLDDEVQKYKP